jgi:hypothetical protein
MAFPSSELEELRSQRCLENEKIQIYHGGGAWSMIQWIAKLGAGVGDILCTMSRHSGALDDSVEFVSHGEGKEEVRDARVEVSVGRREAGGQPVRERPRPYSDGGRTARAGRVRGEEMKGGDGESDDRSEG